jgi:hypothetical protein
MVSDTVFDLLVSRVRWEMDTPPRLRKAPTSQTRDGSDGRVNKYFGTTRGIVLFDVSVFCLYLPAAINHLCHGKQKDQSTPGRRGRECHAEYTAYGTSLMKN